MANDTAMNKPLDGAGLAVVNSVINDRLSKKAGLAELPTKTSQLVNDSGFITNRDVPEGAAASSTMPKMDGTAAAGTETAFARGDHVHPTDTSRLASDGDGSGVTVSFNAAAEKAAPVSGETLAVIMGKLAKNFAGLGELAYKGTVAAGDLDEAVRVSLARADSALQSFMETDPTVPAWAKAAEKPAYTATEVGAIPLSMADSFAKKSEVAGAYIYRGSVAGSDALPASGAAVGDVYNVEDTGMNYGWTGTAWDALGQMFQLDPLSEEEIKAILGVTA
ncbi:MAG: hypothetical protein K2P37_11185 [Oscillospiraceae bacterium]|nr:hypothetical protein [Oscillospiraceae bacterium]